MAAELRTGGEMLVPLKKERPVAVTFNLNWRSHDGAVEPTDLDIGCLYRTGDGRVGAMQAVRPIRGRQVDNRPERATPSIELRSGSIGLDRDDRDGSAPQGETLTFHDAASIEFAVVFAAIYRGVSDFRLVGATLTISPAGHGATAMRLANPDPGLRWCAMVACGTQERSFVVVPQERYFLSGLHADRHYRFGLDWVVGHKDPERAA